MKWLSLAGCQLSATVERTTCLHSVSSSPPHVEGQRGAGTFVTGRPGDTGEAFEDFGVVTVSKSIVPNGTCVE